MYEDLVRPRLKLGNWKSEVKVALCSRYNVVGVLGSMSQKLTGHLKKLGFPDRREELWAHIL